MGLVLGWTPVIITIGILLIVLIISLAWSNIQPSVNWSWSSLGFSEAFAGQQQPSSETPICSDDTTIANGTIIRCSDLRAKIISTTKIPKTGMIRQGDDILEQSAQVILNSHEDVPEESRRTCLHNQNCQNLVSSFTGRLYCPAGASPYRNPETDIVERCTGATDLVSTETYNSNGMLQRNSGINCRLWGDPSTDTPCRYLPFWSYLPKEMTIVYAHQRFKIDATTPGKTEASLKNDLRLAVMSLLLIPYIRATISQDTLGLQENQKLNELINMGGSSLTINAIENAMNASSQPTLSSLLPGIPGVSNMNHFPNFSSWIDSFYNRFIRRYTSSGNGESTTNESRYFVVYYFHKAGRNYYMTNYTGSELENIQISYKESNGFTTTISVGIPRDSMSAYHTRYEPIQVNPATFPSFPVSAFQ
jgi:hypothetical protein